MARHTHPIIEEDFDDDTDLPLPSKPLPNFGTRGALIQAIDSESDDDGPLDDDMEVPVKGSLNPGPASPSQLSGSLAGREDPRNTVSDLTPYKKWTCIYPIYIDAKQPYGVGSRRISSEKAVWWPLSKDIADATTRLGLSTLHEVQKCHPRDWENPGRVRVQWKKDGVLVNNRIKTKKQLIEAIAFYIQSVKPELIPKPTPSTTVSSPAEPDTVQSKHPSFTRSKQQVPTKGKAKAKSGPSEKRIQKAVPQRPHPPEPLPPLASRISAYSPALPSGVLVDTIKAGMNAAAAENAAAGPLAGGKGKRKVVRVRA